MTIGFNRLFKFMSPFFKVPDNFWKWIECKLAYFEDTFLYMDVDVDLEFGKLPGFQPRATVCWPINGRI